MPPTVVVFLAIWTVLTFGRLMALYAFLNGAYMVMWLLVPEISKLDDVSTAVIAAAICVTDTVAAVPLAMLAVELTSKRK